MAQPDYVSEADRIPYWRGPGSGLSRIIAILLFIIALLVVIWALIMISRPSDRYPNCSQFGEFFGLCHLPPPPPAPPEALAECDEQLARGKFSIRRDTAHERYLTETLPTMKQRMYVLVTLRKRLAAGASGYGALSDVRVEVHRPNDVDPLNNLDAMCSSPILGDPTSPANSRGDSEVRAQMYCDMSALQYDQQEQSTGVLKYRVLIKNWSPEPVDYCFVSSCDARYPAGEACNTGYGSPYGTGSYPSASASGGGTMGQ